MKYQLGIIIRDEIPLVSMRQTNKKGEFLAEAEEAPSVHVVGTLTSNKTNQLILVTDEGGKGDKEPKE